MGLSNCFSGSPKRLLLLVAADGGRYGIAEVFTKTRVSPSGLCYIMYVSLVEMSLLVRIDDAVVG